MLMHVKKGWREEGGFAWYYRAMVSIHMEPQRAIGEEEADWDFGWLGEREDSGSFMIHRFFKRPISIYPFFRVFLLLNLSRYLLHLAGCVFLSRYLFLVICITESNAMPLRCSFIISRSWRELLGRAWISSFEVFLVHILLTAWLL